jgi:hypothetical protein
VTTVRVGTASRSLEPAPDEAAGDRWVTDHDACATLSEATIINLLGGDLSMVDHLASTGSPWPNNPDCIYMGGYGIGPMNPITHIHDDHGMGVRGVAILDDDDTALVLVVVDAVGWFWEYGSKCSDCGIRQITERMGRTGHRPVRDRRRVHPLPHRPGLHGRLGVRARLVHGAGNPRDRGRHP